MAAIILMKTFKFQTLDWFDRKTVLSAAKFVHIYTYIPATKHRFEGLRKKAIF